MPHDTNLTVLLWTETGNCHQAVLTPEQLSKLKVFLFHLTQGEIKASSEKLPITLKDLKGKKE